MASRYITFHEGVELNRVWACSKNVPFVPACSRGVEQEFFNWERCKLLFLLNNNNNNILYIVVCSNVPRFFRGYPRARWILGFSAVHSQNKLNDQSFSQFPPSILKKRGTLEQNFFLLCNQGFTRLFLFHGLGTKWNSAWNKVLAWCAVYRLE